MRADISEYEMLIVDEEGHTSLTKAKSVGDLGISGAARPLRHSVTSVGGRWVQTLCWQSR